MTSPSSIPRRLAGASPAVLKALGDAFTCHTTFLAELIQNARRSGSPEVRIAFDADAGTLSVEDFGSGIGSMEPLLTLGESGWDVEVMGRDRPFGLGLLACLYVAKTIRIESTGVCFDAQCAELLAGRDGAEGPGCREKGTLVRLSGLGPEVVRALRAAVMADTHGTCFMFSAFSIPVFINGEELPRPYSLEALAANPEYAQHETPVGPAFARVGYMPAGGRCALQGLFVLSAGCYGWNDFFPHFILHVTCPDVRTRCPDRTQFAAASESQVKSALAVGVLKATAADLQRLRAAGDWSTLFRHRRALSDCGLVSLLNDAPFLPASCFVDPYQSEALRVGRSMYSVSSDVRVERSDVTSGAVRLFVSPDLLGSMADEEMHPHKLNALAYIGAHRGVVLRDGDLDSEHWAVKAAEPFAMTGGDDAPLVTVAVEPTREAQSPVYSNTYATIAIAPAATLSGPLGVITVTGGLISIPDSEGAFTRLVVVGGAPLEAAVLTIYDDGDEGAEFRDQADLDALMATLNADDPTALMTRALRPLTARLTDFGDGQFVVAASGGRLSVTWAPTALAA